MKEVNLYTVILTYSYTVEAKSTQDAVNKAQEYVESNSGNHVSQVSSCKAWVEAEED